VHLFKISRPFFFNKLDEAIEKRILVSTYIDNSGLLSSELSLCFAE
jgi:hypothetical protein